MAPAIRTRVEVTTFLSPDREGEIVTARFARDPEIGAGASPLRAVGSDAPPPGAKLREQMRQLMTQSALDLDVAVGAEPAIEQDARSSILRPPGGRAEPGGPFDHNARGQSGCAVLEKKIARQGFQCQVSAGRPGRNGRCEREFELTKRQHFAPVRISRANFADARCVRWPQSSARFRKRSFLCLTKSE